MVLLQQTGLELQDPRAMCERMHRLQELLAAKKLASNSVIIPGTFLATGHRVPRRGCCTQRDALPLLNLVASTSACTRSEPLHSPPPPPHAAHAANKSQMVLMRIPRDCWVVGMIT